MSIADANVTKRAEAVTHELILASAGSGKTFTIATRFIALLCDGAPPEAVFASTFTRKAAGEIAQRILGMLANAALSDRAARELATHTKRPKLTRERCLELLRGLLASLHRLNISTLDSFFVRVAGSFALELGMGLKWTISDDVADVQLRSEAIESLLRETDAAQLVHLIRRIDRGSASRSIHDRLMDLVASFHGVYEQTAANADGGREAWHWITPPDQSVLTPQEVGELVERIAGTECPRTKDGRPSARWDSALRDLVSCARSGNWFSFIANKLVAKVIAGEPQYDRKDIDAALVACIEPLIEHARIEVLRALAEQTQAIHELLRRYDAEYRRLQRERGRFRFNDLTMLLAGDADEPALAARQNVYYRLDSRIAHVLLDEFQDTSLSQWQALEPVVDEVLSNRQERAALIVADPKQSIYGWRGGEPSLVQAVGDRYELQSRPLQKSYRTSQQVLDGVNAVFGDLAGNAVFHRPCDQETAARWAEAFTEHEAAKPELPGYVRICAAPDKDNVLQHAAAVVKQVAEAAPSCDVGVLVRTNTAVRTLVDELRRVHGVAASEEGGNPLTDSPAVVAVTSLLRMADHPGDTVSRFHVACGPLGKVLNFTDHGSERAACALAHEVRRSLIVHGYGPTLYRWTELLAPHVDDRDLNRLMQLVELGCRYEQQAALRPGAFVRLIEATRVEDPSASRIRVMTVHQSKGLEFDIVVLAELDGTMGQGRASDLMVYRDEPTGPVTRVTPYVGETVRSILPQLEPVWEQHRARQMIDDLGVLYVAMTRPRYALHAVIKPTSSSEKAQTPGVNASNLLRHALCDGAPAVSGAGDECCYESGDRDWYSRMPRRSEQAAGPAPQVVAADLLKPVTDRNRALPRRTPSGHENRGVVQLDRVLSLDHSGRTFGSAIHRMFQHVQWLDEMEPDEAALLAAAGDGGLVAQFRAMLGRPAVRQTLSRCDYPGAAHVELHNEHPFMHRDNGQIMRGSIDRLVITHDADNQRAVAAHVVDFKTDRVAENGPAALDALVAHYEAQMGAYRRAVAAAHHLDPAAVRVTLLFVNAGISQDV